MADEPDLPAPDATDQTADEQTADDEWGSEPAASEDAVVQGVVTVRPAADPALAFWRSRAAALRSAVPQVARNPVVVGASAAVATVALRVAVDVARRALGASGPSRPVALTLTGSVEHHVHVVRHVHVIHHVVHHTPDAVVLRVLPQTRPPG